MDSDDLMKSDRLVLQANFLMKNPLVLLVGGAAEVMTSSGEKIRIHHYPEKSFLIRKILRYSNCIAHPTVMYRKSFVNSVGGYDTFYEGAEDFDLYTRLIKFGQIRTLRNVVISYRISNQQISKKQSEKQVAATCAVLINQLFEKYKVKVSFQDYIQKSSLVAFVQPQSIFEELQSPLSGINHRRLQVRVKICKFRMIVVEEKKKKSLVILIRLFRRDTLLTFTEILSLLFYRLRKK
jgi:hypothetical protein